MDRTLERMLQKLSLPIRRQLQAVPASCWEQVQEIRLQQGREPYLVVAGRPMRLGQLLHRFRPSRYSRSSYRRALPPCAITRYTPACRSCWRAI